MRSNRRSTATLLTSLILLGLLASCASEPLRPEEGGVLLSAVPVPPTWTDRGLDMPEELRLEEGDEIVRQSYTIELDGRFTFTRSIQRAVGTIGLRAAELGDRRAERLGVSSSAGVVVDSTVSGLPAAEAGLRRDDVLTRFAGKEVLSLDQLAALVRETKPGTAVRVDFVRGGETKQSDLVVAAQQVVVGARALSRTLPVLDDSRHSGLVLAELSDEVRPLILGGDTPDDARGSDPESVHDAPGLLVIGMLVGGPAYFSEIRHRDLLLEFGGRKLRTLGDFEAALDEQSDGSWVRVRAVRGDRRLETELRVSSNALRKTRFGFIGVFNYDHRPNRTSFSLLWDLLYASKKSHGIEERDQQSYHETIHERSFLLGLCQMTTTPSRKQIRLLWLFPITFSSS